MSNILNFEVSEEFNGVRLDKWLATVMPDFSRSKIQQFIKNGCITKNGTPVESQRIDVATGDVYCVNVPEEQVEVTLKPENIPLDILYEDDDIIVINKPAGMVVHQGAGVNSGTLVNALLYHCNGKLSNAGGDVGRQGIVHRLDKDTSGAMMACKTDKAYRIMQKQFADHSVKREYYALLWGMPNPISGRIEKNIGRNPHSRQEMTVVIDGGKTAITNYETLEVFSGAKFKPLALVKCLLETGRTHQIRVHMSSIGTPILGDSVYGNPARHITQVENEEVRTLLLGIKRQMLHSKNIEFTHPITGEKMKFETKLPSDMQEIIDFFRGE
ncbi:MAG: RluA family pseudouridine synthase [Alphaproteobacteria bacterium]|nr:RluA family pseudouridine synthase [Alphaproteobacteria bacterium]